MKKAGLMPIQLLIPEDRDDMFLRNVGGLLADYKALYPRRYNFRMSLLKISQMIIFVKN
jgi:hypothetical protein